MDQITIGAGDNVVLGDNGVAEFEPVALINISTIDAGAGANDTIASGAGYNVIFGGDADDSIQAGIDSTTDIVVGDNGSAVFESGILRVISTSPSIGGIDNGNVGLGEDIVFGGIAADIIVAGDSSDVVVMTMVLLSSMTLDHLIQYLQLI